MSNELPDERVIVLSVNPDGATRDDVSRMASELSEYRRRVRAIKRANHELLAVMNLSGEDKETTSLQTAREYAHILKGNTVPVESKKSGER
ncbi:MAG: hypothetical protein WCJ37_05670 [Syntrophus sp. (in: bacteria)]